MKKHLIFVLLIASMLSGCVKSINSDHTKQSNDFIKVSGKDLVNSKGEKYFIQGVNIGQWLNPEGYMFRFHKTNSPRFINELICQIGGPEFATDFWQSYKDNYITKKDIEFIASTGANTIRLPFHYKLFTNEDYLGLYENQDGFARIDSAVAWCKAAGLRLILDMHDCPGGQTGDNIDDSYGYPWLFESEKCQQQFCDIWVKIADYYKNEPVILGYELMNEPIPHYLENKEELIKKIEPLYKRATSAIRDVDTNHIIILGGAQWNTRFDCFTDYSFDDNMMYSCHFYGGPACQEALQCYVDFRDKVNLPMYMGETGHGTYEWLHDMSVLMNKNNIGWTYWPIKKVEKSAWLEIKRPENWDHVLDYSEADRVSYREIQAAAKMYDLKELQQSLLEYLENCKFENCLIDTIYIQSIGLRVGE